MNYEDIVKQLLGKLGFQPHIVNFVSTEQTADGVKVRVYVDNTMYGDVPFLSGGRVVALLQNFVKKLPDKREDGVALQWQFEPLDKTDAAEEIEKEASVKTATTQFDAADLKILDSAVGRLGYEVLKSPIAIDVLVGLGAAQYLIKKLKESPQAKPVTEGEGFWRTP